MIHNKVHWTEEKKEEAIRRITVYLEKYAPGECIMQGDNALLEAPELMAEIADEVLGEEGLEYVEAY